METNNLHPERWKDADGVSNSHRKLYRVRETEAAALKKLERKAQVKSRGAGKINGGSSVT